jgi:hypothetical protein
MKRKTFLSYAGTGAASFLLYPFKTMAAPDPEEPLNKELVQSFVGLSHTNMDKVKAMLEETPTLLNASWDWKGGDFETGLGAASHVGYKELVSYFISKGAQANIFTACLFGNLEVVEKMIEIFPAVLHARGPHGFSLLHHANKGGDEALAVKEFLNRKGLTETKFNLWP